MKLGLLAAGWALGMGLLAVACTEDGTDHGVAPNDSVGGQGGAGASADCVRPLSSLCDDGSCPATPDLAAHCRAGATITRFPSSCGGVSVSIAAGLGVATWHYDAHRNLVGALRTDDTENACGSGPTTHYGETCVASGAAEEVCKGGKKICSQASVCDASQIDLECPKDLQSFEPDCSSRYRFRQFESTCGGTLVQASTGFDSVSWTFDASGKLVGTAWGDDAGGNECWGAPCPLTGAATDLCADDGGGGYGGAGGAGGAENIGAGGATSGGAGGAR